MGFLNDWAKKRKIEAQITKMKLKSELSRYKNALDTSNSNRKMKKMDRVAMQIAQVDDMRAMIAETIPANGFIQVLNNPQVQELAKLLIMKFRGGKLNSAVDSEMFEIWQRLPDDVKAKGKEFLKQYVGEK